MKSLIRTLLVASALLAVACGGKEERGGEAQCGDGACGLHQLCDRDHGEPRCVCEAAWDVEKCDSCAPGYTHKGDSCVPVPIDCADSPCGSHGTCIEDPAGDRCECEVGYGGRLCSQCAAAYQDNDGDGICTEACGHPDVTCESWEACSDESGTVECGCGGHTSGRRCDECRDYRIRLADGPCLATCAVREECDSPLACKESDFADAVCSCPTGSTGADCSVCEPGFTKVDGFCTRPPTPGRVLLGTTDANWTLLSELDVETGDVRPLRRGAPSMLTVDRPAKTLWAGEYTPEGIRFGRYDLASDLIDPVDSDVPLSESITLDWKRQALFWVDGYDGPGTLFRLDLGTGDVREVGPVALRSYDHLAYDPGGDRLVSTQWDQGLVLVAIDPETAALTTLGRPDFHSNLSNPLVQVDDRGRILMIATRPRTEEERLREMLITTAERLGMAPIAADAPVHLQQRYWSEPDQPIELESTRSSGAEIVAYDSYGSSRSGGVLAPAPVHVTVSNPDAVVSITSLAESLRIEIDAGARFASLIVYTGGDSVDLEIAPGFSAPEASIRIVGMKIAHEALQALSPAVRTYTSAAAAHRRVPLRGYLGDTDNDAPPWLIRVEPSSMAVEPIRRLGGGSGFSTLVQY